MAIILTYSKQNERYQNISRNAEINSGGLSEITFLLTIMMAVSGKILAWAHKK